MILFPEFHARYGPWAVIAGASEGIGQAYAHVLAERGLNLVTIARRAEPLQADAELIRRRYRVDVRCVALDLAATDLGQRFDAAIDGLDVGLLVYNACYSRIAEFVDASLPDHLATLDVNCRGPVILAHQLAPRLIQRGRGGILLMSSMSGFQGSALISTYAASKAFNIILAESLWTELAPHGVDALACVAGATATPNFQAITPQQNQSKAFPMRPEAVAREGLDALSKGPVHVTGHLNRFVDRLFGFMSRRRRTLFFSKATRDIYGKTEISK